MKTTAYFPWLLGKIAAVLLLFALLIRPALAQPGNLATYAGGPGQEQFLDLMRLSDGTALVAGTAQDLGWVPATVPRTVLAGTAGIRNTGSATPRIGFILHLAADLGTILHVVNLPAGAAESIAHLKTSNVPGQPTGNLYLSGTTVNTNVRDGGYFLARLDHNFIDGVPTALTWVNNVWAQGYVFDRQPWDVGSDDRLVYILGQSHSADWCAATALDGATGTPVVVPNWRTQILRAGNTEFRGVAAAAPGGAAAVSYSNIIFKKVGRCDLRSWTSADYLAELPDGNGRTRRGTWPLDAFFGTPCDPAAPSTSGSGYSGYRTGPGATYGVSAVAIDRRTNACYIGFNVQTVLPGGQPDFEPAVLALAGTGELRWWSRLYHERGAPSPAYPLGQPVNSTPDQYIDGLAVDYSQPPTASDLVVLARCHGNNVENFWHGNEVAAVPTAQGFQNQFTGNAGNIHISWLGKLALADGTLHHSTYVAEFGDLMTGTGGPAADPNLDGWPSPNAGWADVNTTRLGDVRVGPDGAVAVVGVGRRTMTTRLAYQKMLRAGTGPGTGKGSWNSFVRVYAPDLSTARYSSVLMGAWDLSTGAGGDNTVLAAVLPETGRVLAVGWQKESSTSPSTAAGNPVPTTAVPAWGGSQPLGRSALLASLLTSATAPLPVTLTRFTATRTGPATVALAWETAAEHNNSRFVLEKSRDGRSFTPIATLPGHGSSTAQQRYDYADPAAPTAAYYRLAQYDKQRESATYSPVVAVAAPAAPSSLLVLEPNPAHDFVRVRLSDGVAAHRVAVLDALGRERLVLPAPTADSSFSLGALPAGVYLVRAETTAGILIQRLVVE